KGDGNIIHHYSERIGADNLRKKVMEIGLADAIRKGELYLQFQPIVDSKTLTVNACEALLRWRNETLGEVSPNEFIPVAEETGLIMPIGEWVIEQVCRQIKDWQGTRFDAIGISINLSAAQ